MVGDRDQGADNVISGRTCVQGRFGGPMVGNGRRAHRHQPTQTNQGLGLGVEPGSLVVAEVDAQHGLDAALVVQHQPTQALLVCRDDHPSTQLAAM
jgi:hypothetical protein